MHYMYMHGNFQSQVTRCCELPYTQVCFISIIYMFSFQICIWWAVTRGVPLAQRQVRTTPSTMKWIEV
jgi:hypothetical protein